MQKILNKIVNIICVVVISLCVLILLVFCFGNKADFIGYRAFRVLSESMQPEIPVDSFVLVKEMDPKDLQVGDIISFYSSDPELDGNVNTHRIYAIEIAEDSDVRIFTTKGDNNLKPDDYTVTEYRVIGKVVYTSLFVGKVTTLLSNPIVFGAIIVIPLVLLLYTNIRNLMKATRQASLLEEERILKEQLEAVRQKRAEMLAQVGDVQIESTDQIFGPDDEVLEEYEEVDATESELEAEEVEAVEPELADPMEEEAVAEEVLEESVIEEVVEEESVTEIAEEVAEPEVIEEVTEPEITEPEVVEEPVVEEKKTFDWNQLKSKLPKIDFSAVKAKLAAIDFAAIWAGFKAKLPKINIEDVKTKLADAKAKLPKIDKEDIKAKLDEAKAKLPKVDVDELKAKASKIEIPKPVKKTKTEEAPAEEEKYKIDIPTFDMPGFDFSMPEIKVDTTLADNQSKTDFNIDMGMPDMDFMKSMNSEIENLNGKFDFK